MSKFLVFQQLLDNGKTKVFAVNSKSWGGQLGIIEWYSPWRQYVMSPESETVWNPTCLDDVTAFMRGLMAERRKPEARK